MRLPGSLLALAAVIAGGGSFAASVDGVTQVGASLEPPPTAEQVRVTDTCPDHHDDDLRSL